MNVRNAWKQDITGKGVVVTILDDGIEKDHPDLQKNYVSIYLSIYIQYMAMISVGLCVLAPVFMILSLAWQCFFLVFSQDYHNLKFFSNL